jgi:hypothetical protein
MTATDIIATIVAWNKDVSPEQVQELIEGRAMVSDLAFIREELAQHVSLNEQNAADWAIACIDKALAA